MKLEVDVCRNCMHLKDYHKIGVNNIGECTQTSRNSAWLPNGYACRCKRYID